jgi:acyl-CoA thioesterase FadM
MGDVDAAGILYFPVAYRWLEEMFGGWLRELGHPISGLIRSGEACPCVASAATYPSPVTVDEEIDFALVPTNIGITSFAVAVIARRSDDLSAVVHAGSWHVWSAFAGDGRERTIIPRPLPAWLREALAAVPMSEPPMPGRSAVALTSGGAK